MELRRVLFDYRLTQHAVLVAAKAAGYGIGPSQICQIVSGKLEAFPRHREAIRHALASLRVPTEVIDGIPEIVPRPDRRFGERRNG